MKKLIPSFIEQLNILRIAYSVILFLSSRPLVFSSLVVSFQYPTITSIIFVFTSFLLNEALIATNIAEECHVTRYQVAQYTKRMKLVFDIEIRKLDEYTSSDRFRANVDDVLAAQVSAMRYMPKFLSGLSNYVYRKNIENFHFFEFSYNPEKARHLRASGQRVVVDTSPHSFVDLHGRAYVFVPKRRKIDYYAKYELFHELGHVVRTATLPVFNRKLEPFVLGVSLVVYPFCISWTYVSIPVYFALLFNWANYFSESQVYLDQVRRAYSETAADIFAVSMLDQNDKIKMADLIKNFTLLHDRNISFLLNIQRIESLKRFLTGAAPKDPTENFDRSMNSKISLCLHTAIALCWSEPMMEHIIAYTIFFIIALLIFFRSLWHNILFDNRDLLKD